MAPEVDQDDVAAQVGGRQWRRVEPPGRAVERGHRSFNGQLGRGVRGGADELVGSGEERLPSACILVHRSLLQGARRSVGVDLDDGLGEGLGGFLRQVVPDTTRDEPVRVLAGELLGVGSGIRVWCAIRVTLEGDGGHGDDRSLGKPPFEVLILWLTFCQAKPPSVVVDDDIDVVRIVERLRGAVERGLVEVPARRSKLPDELRKVVPVPFVARAAAFGREVVLVPPLQLSGTSPPTGSGWSRTRAGTERSPGTPPMPATGSPQHSCGCRRATRAAG